MTKGYFSEWCERQHSSSTRGQGTSDSMIGLEWEDDSLSNNQSNFASASQSDEGSPPPENIFAAPDAELTSRNSHTGWSPWWSQHEWDHQRSWAAGDDSWYANTANAACTRQQNPSEPLLVTPPAALREEVPGLANTIPPVRTPRG